MQKCKFLIVCALILTSGFFVSCDRREKVKSGKTKRTLVSSEGDRNIAKEVPETTTNYTDQQKNEYQRQMEFKLMEYDKIEDELNAKSAGFSDDVRTVYATKRGEFRNKKSAAYERLRELKTATSRPGWMDVKNEMDGLMADLASYYDREFSQFR